MKHLALLATALFAVSAQAAVTLNVDDHIKVTAINGQSISQSPFLPLKKQFTLEAGQHAITARYERLYDVSNRDHDVVRSDYVTVTANLADNQSYRLALAGVPERYNDAKEYAKTPTLAIMQGDAILAQETRTAERAGLLSSIGNLFGRGNNQAVQENQAAISAIQAAPTAQPAPAAAQARSATPLITSCSCGSMPMMKSAPRFANGCSNRLKPLGGR